MVEDRAGRDREHISAVHALEFVDCLDSADSHGTTTETAQAVGEAEPFDELKALLTSSVFGCYVGN